MIFIGADLERQEVAEVAAPCLLQLRENVVCRPYEPKVDVFGGTGAL